MHIRFLRSVCLACFLAGLYLASATAASASSGSRWKAYANRPETALTSGDCPTTPPAQSASWTISSGFISNAETCALYAEPGYINYNDCTHWISYFLTQYYGMPSSWWSDHTDSLIDTLIGNGVAQAITGNGNFDDDGTFISLSDAETYYFNSRYLDNLTLESGGNEEFIIAFKWQHDTYPGYEHAGHLALYVGNGQAVSHGTGTESNEWDAVPQYINQFEDVDGYPPAGIAIIALTNSAASAPGWNISLSADNTSLQVGEAVNLTSQASQDVGPTPNWVEIWNDTTDTQLAYCPSGSTCTASDLQYGAQSDTYEADIYGPDGLVAGSNQVTVTWSEPIVTLGSVDLWSYCQYLGYAGVNLYGNTAYDWYCYDSSGNTYGIDMNAACTWQYPDATGVYADYTDFNNPDSWVCYGNGSVVIMAAPTFPTVNFVKGWNAISSESSTATTASSLVASINSALATTGAIQALATYANGQMRVYVPGYSRDVAIQPTEGVFALSTATGQWSLSAWASASAITLQPGWNFVAAPPLVDGKLTASTVVAEIGKTYVNSVALLGSNGYQVWTPAAGTTGDFTVPPTAGIWIDMGSTVPITWNPV